MINCGTLPALWNAAIASENNTSADSGSPSEVCKRAASRARKPSKKCDALLAHEGDALVPRGERARHIRLREREPGDPERVGDPVGIAERPRRGHGFLGVSERLFDPPARLEAVDVRGDAVAAIASVLLCDEAGELDVAVEVAAIHVAQGLDEGGVSGLARVVAEVDLQFGRPVRVRASSFRPPGEARVTGGGVEAGETADVGGGCGLEQRFGPGQRLEELHRETHQRGVGGDVGRRVHRAAGRTPLVSGAQVVQLRLDPVDRVAPPGPVPVRPSGGRLDREVRGMTIASDLERARLDQTVLGELADGLEQPVSSARGDGVGDDERFSYERVEVPEHVDVVTPVDHRADAREVEAAREDRGDARGARARRR